MTKSEKFLADYNEHNANRVPVLNCPEDCEGEFSWSRCDVCGSGLGGVRHPVVFFRRFKNGKVAKHYYDKGYACEDCTLFIANGDLPLD